LEEIVTEVPAALPEDAVSEVAHPRKSYPALVPGEGKVILPLVSVLFQTAYKVVFE
jgi:hypothetical protein